MIRLHCNEITILHGYFTIPEPLLEWREWPDTARKRTLLLVEVNNNDLTERMLAPWVQFFPPDPDCTPSKWWCSQPCPCQAGRPGFPGTTSQLKAPGLRSPAPFSMGVGLGSFAPINTSLVQLWFSCRTRRCFEWQLFCLWDPAQCCVDVLPCHLLTSGGK